MSSSGLFTVYLTNLTTVCQSQELVYLHFEF